MTVKAFLFVAALATPSAASAQSTSTDSTHAPAPGAKAADKAAAKLSRHETQTVAHYHHVNGMEIRMGKLAQRRGTAAVKRYGEQLQLDHVANDKELTALAKRRGIAKIPADKPATEVERQDLKLQMKAMAGLAKLAGAAFDREFLRQMVDAHDKELARTDVALASTTDAELKTYLETTKSALQRHADTARELQKGTAQASAAPAAPGPKSSR